MKRPGRVKCRLETMWRDTKVQLMRLFHGKPKEMEKCDDFDDGWSLDGQHEKKEGSIRTTTTESSDDIKQRASPPQRPDLLSHLNSFDTGFIPPEGELRDDWTRYVQLAHCSRWALDNVFGKCAFTPFIQYILNLMQP